MQISIEQISINADRSFQAYEYDFLSRDQSFHSHDAYELAMVTRAGGLLYCGAETSIFNPGDIFLFGRRLPHRFLRLSDSSSTARVIQFRHDAFGNGFFGLPENHQIRKLLNAASSGLIFRQELLDCSCRLSRVIKADVSRRLPELLLLLSDLADIVVRGDAVRISPEAVVFTRRSVDEERLYRLQDFIESEFTGHISLDEAANVLALTRTSFCRYVKRLTGRTFTALVNDYRLVAAAIMLRDSTPGFSSVAVVSGEVGFGSLSHFNSQFKARFGLTPTSYRKVGIAERSVQKILEESTQAIPARKIDCCDKTVRHKGSLLPTTIISDKEKPGAKV